MVNLGIVGRRKRERKREEEEESLRSKPHKRLGKSQIRTQTRIWVVVLLFLFVFLFRFKTSCLTKGKKAIFFAVPGAFTPTCSQKHVPGFVEKAAELKAKGVDTIACISVNDAFVLKAWKKALNIGDELLILSDGNGNFTKAIGVELDLSDNPVGLGVRSRRYSMLVEDGVVKLLNLEEGGAFTLSGAEDILKAL